MWNILCDAFARGRLTCVLLLAFALLLWRSVRIGVGVGILLLLLLGLLLLLLLLVQFVFGVAFRYTTVSITRTSFRITSAAAASSRCFCICAANVSTNLVAVPSIRITCDRISVCFVNVLFVMLRLHSYLGRFEFKSFELRAVLVRVVHDGKNLLVLADAKVGDEFPIKIGLHVL